MIKNRTARTTLQTTLPANQQSKIFRKCHTPPENFKIAIDYDSQDKTNASVTKSHLEFYKKWKATWKTQKPLSNLSVNRQGNLEFPQYVNIL